MVFCRMLPVLLLTAGAAATVTSQGDAEVPTHVVFGAVNSSVQFPQVEIDKDTAYELKKGKFYVVVFHGFHTVREPYGGRGEFFPGNGTFLLRSLKKGDSGTYEHWVNMTVSAKINLQVIERATEPTLVRVNLGEDLQLECAASGDGPLVVTILRDGKEVISENVTREDGGVTTLLIHCGDPDSAGRYTCSSSNPVSSVTSNVIELLPTATLLEVISVHVVLVMMTHWCLLVIRRCYLNTQAKKQNNARRKGAGAGPVRKPHAAWQAFTHADFLLGFLCELAAAAISWSGHFIPFPWNNIPAGLFTCLMACRIPYCLERFQKYIISCITYICGLITQVSEFLLIPVFCGYVIYVFSIVPDGGPCGLGVWGRVRWGLAVFIYGLVWITLSGISYTYITKKENKNDQNPTAVPGDPENVDPLPQPSVELSSENPRKPGWPDCGGPLDTEGDPQERLSMIPESNEMFYDRDRVANG